MSDRTFKTGEMKMKTTLEVYMDKETTEEQDIWYEVCEHHMDDDLREMINCELVSDDISKYEYLTLYAILHKQKFNKLFIIN